MTSTIKSTAADRTSSLAADRARGGFFTLPLFADFAGFAGLSGSVRYVQFDRNGHFGINCFTGSHRDCPGLTAEGLACECACHPPKQSPGIARRLSAMNAVCVRCGRHGRYRLDRGIRTKGLLCDCGGVIVKARIVDLFEFPPAYEPVNPIAREKLRRALAPCTV